VAHSIECHRHTLSINFERESGRTKARVLVGAVPQQGDPPLELVLASELQNVLYVGLLNLVLGV
jgi:hypothetical protein